MSTTAKFTDSHVNKYKSYKDDCAHFCGLLRKTELFMIRIQKWYFVTKIVLTYGEKKNVLVIEITKTIYLSTYIILVALHDIFA